MVQVIDATAVLETPKVEESLGSKFKGLFGKGKTEDGGEQEAEVEKSEDEKKVEELLKKLDNSSATAGSKTEDKVVEQLVPLKVGVESGAVKGMLGEEKKASRTR